MARRPAFRPSHSEEVRRCTPNTPLQSHLATLTANPPDVPSVVGGVAHRFIVFGTKRAGGFGIHQGAKPHRVPTQRQRVPCDASAVPPHGLRYRRVPASIEKAAQVAAAREWVARHGRAVCVDRIERKMWIALRLAAVNLAMSLATLVLLCRIDSALGG